jgi:hypothetical protein
LKIRFLWSSAAAALAVAAVLAGCGGTTYFAGRNLPPSGLTNRVMIAVQNPSALTKGSLQFVDAYYDIRSGTGGKPAGYGISGYSGALPVTIQNMPEEQTGYVYGSGDGSFVPISYAKETAGASTSGLNGLSSSIFVTRNQSYVFAASQASRVLTVIDHTNGGSYPLSLPGVYRVSVNPGGSSALAFVQNSNFAYYPMKLSSAQTVSYSGGPPTWPKAAVDCEPQNSPGWCLFQAQSPDHVDSTGRYYGAPLNFDRPVKAVFSIDGGTAYVLNCGPECGGPINTPASVSILPVAPMIYLIGQASGTLPTNATLAASTIAIPGGASNALVDSSTMYVVGQQPQQVPVNGQMQTLFAGNLTVVNLSNNTAGSAISISDGLPGGPSRIIEADNDTLWIGMTKCNNGVRANNPAAYPSGYGCLTMFNTSTDTVTMLEPYLGDATGIAAVTGLNKIYTAEGGQVYIYTTTDGIALDNQYVTVTGTAYDVAYMDATSDADNTVY